MKHCPTLETLVVKGCDGFMNNDIVRILSNSPKLSILFDNDNDSYWNDRIGRLHAEVFIDQDPTTGTLRPWACESTLKELIINITGIPRPDLQECTTVRELYPGQGREIQSQVYDRLARLTNLEKLWLGGLGYGPYSLDYEYAYETQDSRYDCLEVSLESGLWKLAGLKALKELNVTRMKTRIRLGEIQ